MFNNALLKYSLLICSVFLSGCMATLGSEELARLQYGLARVNKQNKAAVEKLEKKEVALEKKIAVLEEEVQDLKKETAANREAIGKIEPGALAGKDWILPREKDGQLFQSAHNDYLKGQYSLAIMGFQEYLRLYPEGLRAAEAQYWLAESCFSQKDFKSAVEEFDKLLKTYPKSRWFSPALYKKALSLAREERPAEALVITEEIIERFPESKENKLARELKKELENQISKDPPR
ncbi:MAG: tol-pal system protein YbgF [Candidatus Ratteibacteria bacterium]|nr:tol-pal system protein YbgF [Candidatus Ratteibacteria bacterium]